MSQRTTQPTLLGMMQNKKPDASMTITIGDSGEEKTITKAQAWPPSLEQRLGELVTKLTFSDQTSYPIPEDQDLTLGQIKTGFTQAEWGEAQPAVPNEQYIVLSNGKRQSDTWADNLWRMCCCCCSCDYYRTAAPTSLIQSANIQEPPRPQQKGAIGSSDNTAGSKFTWPLVLIATILILIGGGAWFTITEFDSPHSDPGPAAGEGCRLDGTTDFNDFSEAHLLPEGEHHMTCPGSKGDLGFVIGNGDDQQLIGEHNNTGSFFMGPETWVAAYLYNDKSTQQLAVFFPQPPTVLGLNANHNRRLPPGSIGYMSRYSTPLAVTAELNGSSVDGWSRLNEDTGRRSTVLPEDRPGSQQLALKYGPSIPRQSRESWMTVYQRSPEVVATWQIITLFPSLQLRFPNGTNQSLMNNGRYTLQPGWAMVSFSFEPQNALTGRLVVDGQECGTPSGQGPQSCNVSVTEDQDTVLQFFREHLLLMNAT